MTDLNTYKLSFVGYHVYLAFRDHTLWMIQLPDKGVPGYIQSKFLEGLPSEEKKLKDYNCFFVRHQMHEVSRKGLEEAKTQQDKIILFGMAFKHYRGMAYNSSDKEKANIKNVPVNKKLLATFFESPGVYVFTIENYIQRINVTKDFAMNGFPDQRAPKFPQGWDRDFWMSLDDKTRPVYEKHLMGLGFEKKQSGAGYIYFAEKEVHHG